MNKFLLLTSTAVLGFAFAGPVSAANLIFNTDTGVDTTISTNPNLTVEGQQELFVDGQSGATMQNDAQMDSDREMRSDTQMRTNNDTGMNADIYTGTEMRTDMREHEINAEKHRERMARHKNDAVTIQNDDSTDASGGILVDAQSSTHIGMDSDAAMDDSDSSNATMMGSDNDPTARTAGMSEARMMEEDMHAEMSSDSEIESNSDVNLDANSRTNLDAGVGLDSQSNTDTNVESSTYMDSDVDADMRRQGDNRIQSLEGRTDTGVDASATSDIDMR